MSKIERFKEIVAEMATLYENKNKDYGDSFGKSIKEHGDKVQLTNIHIQTINLYSLNNISPVSKSNGDTKSVENPDLYFE